MYSRSLHSLSQLTHELLMKTNMVKGCLTQLYFFLQDVCHCYWPLDSESSESYGKYQVLLTSEETEDEYIVRKMDISDSQATMSPGDNGFTVTQFQYVRWPEDGVPQSTTGVLEMANLVQKVQMGSGNKAIVVMCK